MVMRSPKSSGKSSLNAIIFVYPSSSDTLSQNDPFTLSRNDLGGSSGSYSSSCVPDTPDEHPVSRVRLKLTPCASKEISVIVPCPLSEIVVGFSIVNSPVIVPNE